MFHDAGRICKGDVVSCFHMTKAVDICDIRNYEGVIGPVRKETNADLEKGSGNKREIQGRV